MGQQLSHDVHNPVISDCEYRWWVMFPGGNCPTDLGVNFVPPPLPPMFHGLLSAPEWDQFTQAVAQQVANFVNAPKWLFPVCVVLFILAFGVNVLPPLGVRMPGFISQILFVTPFLVGFGYMGQVIIPKNQAVDNEIRNVCAQFTSAWAGKGVTIQYQTQHTGLCKPKHARSSRAIHVHKPAGMPMTMNMPMAPGQVVVMAPAVGGTVIGMSPPGAAPSPQTMQITLPLDFIPGQPMQVQTPAGTIITVNAPPGAVGGQVIQVQY